MFICQNASVTCNVEFKRCVNSSKHSSNLNVCCPFLGLVLTSCASLPTTPMRNCTRCLSWPSARAARASACSDPHRCHRRVRMDKRRWAPFNSLLRFYTGIFDRYIQTTTTLLGWESNTGSSRRISWNCDWALWTLVLQLIKYIAIVLKEMGICWRVWEAG